MASEKIELELSLFVVQGEVGDLKRRILALSLERESEMRRFSHIEAMVHITNEAILNMKQNDTTILSEFVKTTKESISWKKNKAMSRMKIAEFTLSIKEVEKQLLTKVAECDILKMKISQMGKILCLKSKKNIQKKS